MKRYYLFILFFACTLFNGCIISGIAYMGRLPMGNVNDNQGTSEIDVSYGRLSGTEMIYAFGNSGDTYYTNKTTLGEIFGTYRYYVSDRIALGLSVGDQSINFAWAEGNGSPTYTEKINLATAAIEMKSIMQESNFNQTYGIIGVGGTKWTDSYNEPQVAPIPYNRLKLNTQFSIGERIGGRFGGFVELGVGYKGILNGGLYFKL